MKALSLRDVRILNLKEMKCGGGGGEERGCVGGGVLKRIAHLIASHIQEAFAYVMDDAVIYF
jgi:hypothetical protein